MWATGDYDQRNSDSEHGVVSKTSCSTTVEVIISLQGIGQVMLAGLANRTRSRGKNERGEDECEESAVAARHGARPERPRSGNYYYSSIETGS